MNYIQFESARDKEKSRNELREAREELLQQAKERAEQRNKRDLEKKLSGEKDWLLPAVANKLKDLSKATKSKKSKNKKNKHKSKSKSSKKSKKKHKRRRSSSESSSSNESESDSSSSSSNSSSEDETKRKRRKKESRKGKRKSESEDEDEWVEAAAVNVPDTKEDLQRDSWMTSEALMLKTFSRERKEPAKPNEKQPQIDAYDPAKSSRELNPYWNSNGTGLPSFKKPQADDENDDNFMATHRATQRCGVRNWQKSSTQFKNTTTTQPQAPNTFEQKNDSFDKSEESSSEDAEGMDSPKQQAVQFLTDEQMNDLAAKVVKAELKGKTELATEYKQQLENARKARADALASGQTMLDANSKRRTGKTKHTTDSVLLTRTDQSGNVRPLVQSHSADASTSRHGEKRSRKKVETHEDGQRVRYFADDDRYDIKQMFQREKHATAAESNLQFANIVSKHKNPNDDLEDIFADKVRKNISEADAEKREMQQAINEHQKLAATLENCERCFDSTKLDKQLMVSLGTKIYLSLPWYIGLQNGHCILTSMQHVACCTQLDEDAWEELNDFRKALTRMFAAQRKDVVFYEIANKLHKRPHLQLHCIPIPESRAEMAPFYFKKAIEESEQEWCINKQLVSLKKKSLRNSIPKGLPYLWVNFGMESGFAHVIEDQERFPFNFAQEIIGGMLELNPNNWRKPRKEQNSIVKVKSFAESWKKYDIT